jgi:hypothetical protein
VRATSYLRRSLLIPILAPFVAWILGVILPTNATVTAAFAFIAAGLYFGVPYLVVAAIAVFWSRGRSEAELRRCAWVAPILFAPLAAWSYLHPGPGIEGASSNTPLSTVVTVALLAMTVGYGYTLVVLLSLDALKRRGQITSDHVPGGA